MPRPTLLATPDELNELVRAQLRAEQRRPGFLGEDPDDVLPEVDDELALFDDHDHLRGHGRGVYVFDQEEAESRRLDLEQLRPAPKTVALEPPKAGESGIELDLGD